MGQGTRQGVLWGQGSFGEEAMSALSSKEQGVAPAGGWHRTHQLHTMGVQESGVMEKSLPSGPEDQSHGRQASSLLEGCGTHSLCATSVQAVGVWREHTTVPEDVALISPLSSQMS